MICRISGRDYPRYKCLSELMKAAPHPKVAEWIEEISISTVFTSSITQAEILYGIEILPFGARKDALSDAAREMFEQLFSARILPFDRAAANFFATIASNRRRQGRPISAADAQIASIVRSVGAVLATRNTADFESCDVNVVNPRRSGE